MQGTNFDLSTRQNWSHEMCDLTGDFGSSISICANTPHLPHAVKSRAQTLINSMKKDHRLVHPKFRPYLDRFIRGLVSNSLRCSIAECNLEITYSEAMTRAARKKLTGRVAQKGGVITI